MRLVKNLTERVNKNHVLINKGKWINIKFVLQIDNDEFLINIFQGKN